MFSSVLSAAIVGVESIPIHVEADVSDGLPMFNMVGYLSAEVREAQERVKTAMRNIGMALPPKRITINLSPADLRKDGSRFDLPIAASVLIALGKIKPQRKKILLVGELSLDGTVHSVTGILSIVAMAKEAGCEICIVPLANRLEGRLVSAIEVIGVENMQELIDFLNDGVVPLEKKDSRLEENTKEAIEAIEGKLDFADIQGQTAAKRAAIIAVSGFHNLMLIGPPGSGKTMIAKRLPSIMPMLTREESIEISKIYSIVGLLKPDQPLLSMRPFRSPHHTLSPQALAGGGMIPKPGEITLAHRGILFLDEFTEFSKRSLEILRQPLEDHEIYIARTNGSYRFPANFMLVGAMNPCNCGYYPDMNRCTCLPADVNRYLHKISKPLLDRIDICVEASEVTYQEVVGRKREKTSQEIRKEVMQAQEIQKERYQGTGIRFNADLTAKEIEKYCPLENTARILLEKAFKKMKFSARAYHRILKTARTIADLEAEQSIKTRHIGEAICYRTLDKKYWER